MAEKFAARVGRHLRVDFDEDEGWGLTISDVALGYDVQVPPQRCEQFLAEVTRIITNAREKGLLS